MKSLNQARGLPRTPSVDRDGDGVLGESEADRVPELRASFARIDTAGDGLIRSEEFAGTRR